MGALIIAMVPIMTGLFAGHAVAVVLAGLTLPEWAAVAAAIATIMVPQTAVSGAEIATAKKVEESFRNLHPALDQLWADVVKLGPNQAAKNAATGFTWPT